MFKLKHRSRKLIPVLAVLLSTQACVDSNHFDFNSMESVTLQPSVALPLLHGKLTIGDLLSREESSNIMTDDDNLIHIIYSDTLASRSIHDYFLLKSLIMEDSYPVTTSTLLQDSEVVNEQYPLDLDFSEADFDEITLKSGKVKLAISSTVQADINVKLHFPNLKKNGQTLSREISFPINSNTAKSEEIDLSGYVIDLSQHGLGENVIPVNVTATTSNQQLGVGQISARVEIVNLEYSLLTGYFGQPEVDLPSDSIKFSIFENIFSKANFGLKNPSLSFDFLNSNGASIQAQIHQFEARKSTGETLTILTDPVNSLTIDAPAAPGEETITSLIVTNEEEVIKFAPSSINFRFSGQLNPNGRTTTPNFLTDKSRAAVVVKADIPLWGYLEGFTLSDTLPLGIGLENETDYIKEASIKVLVKNQLPLNARVRIDFVDANNTILETLFLDEPEGFIDLIPGSKVNAEGDLIESGVFDEEIPVTPDRFEKILKAENAIISATFSTSQLNGTFPYVKIKADQALSINMGVKTTAKNLIVKLEKEAEEQ